MLSVIGMNALQLEIINLLNDIGSLKSMVQNEYYIHVPS
jgi:hypothetical protein